MQIEAGKAFHELTEKGVWFMMFTLTIDTWTVILSWSLRGDKRNVKALEQEHTQGMD